VLPVQVARGFPEGAHHLAARAAPDCQRTKSITSAQTT